MIRKFIQDVGGTAENPRHKAGEIKDYPIQTWRGMAQSLGISLKNTTKALDKFSEAVTVS